MSGLSEFSYTRVNKVRDFIEINLGGKMLDKSDYSILGAAFISFLLSVALWFGIFGEDQKLSGIFVGIWVPSILTLGIYFRLKAGGR